MSVKSKFQQVIAIEKDSETSEEPSSNNKNSKVTNQKKVLRKSISA